MTKTEEKKFNKDIKPVKHILDTYATDKYYSNSNTLEDWKTLLNIHYKWFKKNKGNRECEGCQKYMKVCREINNLRHW